MMYISSTWVTLDCGHHAAGWKSRMFHCSGACSMRLRVWCPCPGSSLALTVSHPKSMLLFPVTRSLVLFRTSFSVYSRFQISSPPRIWSGFRGGHVACLANETWGGITETAGLTSFYFICFYFYFWLQHKACGILVPYQRLNPGCGRESTKS